MRKKREEDSMASVLSPASIPDGEKRGHMSGWCSSDPLGM